MDTAISYQNVHNKFKINGFHLNREDLWRVAYSFIKEGEDFEKPVGDFILDWFNDDPFLEIQTSGSTGIPKKIRVEKQSMVNSALATGDYFDLKPGDRVLHCLPVKYVAGKMMFVRAFILGLELDFVAPCSNPMERIKDDYDFAAMVPLQAKNSIDKLHHIKKIIIGGAKITKDLEKALGQIPVEIYETYGMTETISHIAAKKVGDTNFSVFPGINISQDENECLIIKAPHLNKEILHTHDIVSLSSDNSFTWLGRFDHVINSGGIKMMPEVIEEKLSGKINKRYFISSEKDPSLGEKIVLFIEGEHFEIDSKIFDVLDKYERPKAIYFSKHFDETPNGKILRKTTAEKIIP